LNFPKLMTLFHLSFTLLGILALLLMASKILFLDWSAFAVIVIAVVLNTLFGALWLDELVSPKVEKHEIITEASHVFPMVSLIAPVYNQEQNIASFIKGLFNCASNYRGPSEIIIVDDGSTDKTYESAWTAMGSIHKEQPNIRAQVIKHMSHLGRAEAVKTGANKAMGEYLALLDATAPCESVSLNKLVDTIFSSQKAMINYEATALGRNGRTAVSSLMWLYNADILRRTLNEEQSEKSARELKL